MRAGESASAQLRIMDEGILLDHLGDRTQSSVLQLAHIELALRRVVFRPTQEDVTGRLHGALTLDNPPAGMIPELRPEPFEHGLLSLLELQEQGRAVRTEEQPNGTKRADAANADSLERHILEFISLEQGKP